LIRNCPTEEILSLICTKNSCCNIILGRLRLQMHRHRRNRPLLSQMASLYVAECALLHCCLFPEVPHRRHLFPEFPRHRHLVIECPVVTPQTNLGRKKIPKSVPDGKAEDDERGCHFSGYGLPFILSAMDFPLYRLQVLLYRLWSFRYTAMGTHFDIKDFCILTLLHSFLITLDLPILVELTSSITHLSTLH
jgi:hypothetical protein